MRGGGGGALLDDSCDPTCLDGRPLRLLPLSTPPSHSYPDPEPDDEPRLSDDVDDEDEERLEALPCVFKEELLDAAGAK